MLTEFVKLCSAVYRYAKVWLTYVLTSKLKYLQTCLKDLLLSHNTVSLPHFWNTHPALISKPGTM